MLIPAGDLIFSPRTGFGNARRRCASMSRSTALAAGSHHGATLHQHEALARAVRGEGAVAVTAEDGLRAVAMGVAAETGAREKRIVAMAELGF